MLAIGDAQVVRRGPFGHGHREAAVFPSDAKPRRECVVGFVVHACSGGEVEAQSEPVEPVGELDVLGSSQALVETAGGDQVRTTDRSVRRKELTGRRLVHASGHLVVLAGASGRVPAEPRGEPSAVRLQHRADDDGARISRTYGEVLGEQLAVRYDVVVKEPHHVTARVLDALIARRRRSTALLLEHA